MPELCRFLGIIVYVLYDDHAPAHFHANYGDYHIAIQVESGIIEGKFPKRALGFVLEWYAIHKDELRELWNLAQAHQPIEKIPPLE